uniref:Uncharacterized protein n=1 Tax=Oryza glaberrima TaxID=4538 RepID=I1PXC2_ORYGL
MTINKSQRQTIPNIGIYLLEPLFSYGQLYVALSRSVSRLLSRSVSRLTTRILAKPKKEVDSIGKSTKNIVYKDVLNW